MKPEDFLNDLPLDLATAAHSGTSLSPEVRGESVRKEWASILAADYGNLRALRDEHEAISVEEFDRAFGVYRARLLELRIAALHAQSRCFSTMIAGASNFPVRRAQKASASADRRVEEYLEFRKRALVGLRRLVNPGEAPMLTSNADTPDRLRAKIELAEKAQERMKLINGAIRKTKNGSEQDKIDALASVGVEGAEARSLLTPDCLGRVGFPDYAISNNSANIRRMKARLEHVERVRAEPVQELAVGEGGIRFVDAPTENRVRLYFPGKPDEATRSRLKGSGFRWTPTLGCWQAFRNHSSDRVAREIAGVGPAPAP